MTDIAAKPGEQIPVATLPNLRDIGGYVTADGSTVRRGQLYRSVLLGRLSDEDLATVTGLGLSTVFDFRTSAEFESTPDRYVGARSVNLDVLADRTGTGPASLLAKMDDPAAISAALSNGQGEQMMREAYRDLIELPSANRSFARFFTELAESESLPALFHCTTGKDRTGWAAATTLTFLGVSREDVYHDYLQTNPQLLPALKPIFDQFESVGGNPGDLRPVLSVDRSYLDTAMDLMHERYGSIDGYMKEGLGLGPEILEALRARLLVG
ncbi:MAG: tyrosine-protein phosphatase [Solirubrobacterales bacterium]|nr:tyrosine-protein phosphatase [Solirubrobacterales bacterium]